MDKIALENYNNWITSSYIDLEDKNELKKLENNEKEIEEIFYTNLSFGTGGMRGIIGLGTNRINKYTIRKATQGLANYILESKDYNSENNSVAIAYDCRINSEELALNSALVLAGNGIKTYLFKSLRSTPELSFAVRELKCISGIVITASHNPQEYNGYKVYWKDGGQLVDPQASGIVNKVNEIKSFSEIKIIEKAEAIEKGLLEYISEEMDTKYTDTIKKQLINKDVKNKNEFKIVYSPLHGTGGRPVKIAFKEAGFDSLFVVPEQEKPDGYFPTCPYANPEDSAVFKLSIELAEKVGANLCMANDPDADRIGVAVKDKDGEWFFPNGNQIGILLSTYILKYKKDISENPSIISTIVSTPMLDAIAKKNNIKVFRTLTGFKYIGEKIREFEEKKYNFSYLFGFEESFGYLIGTHARDKDGIVTALLIAEMAAYYESIGSNIIEELEKVYEEYGYYQEGIISVTKSGRNGITEIQNIMKYLRENVTDILIDTKIISKIDYNEFQEGLPKADVIKFELEGNISIIARPSGTEPKIKYYFSVTEKTEKETCDKLELVKLNFENFINNSI